MKNETICDCNIIHQDKVNLVKNKMITAKESNSLANFFKLFGDQTRIRIIFAIDQSELCVCDIANILNMTKSSISHQLATLRKSGVVKSRRDGKEVYYSLDDEHVKLVYELGFEHIRHIQNNIL